MINAPELIRRHRLAAGLSQRELARRAGTSSATLHRYESGQIDPTTCTLNRILRACLPRRRRWSSIAELAFALAKSLRTESDTDADTWRLVAEFLDDDQQATDDELRLVLSDPPLSGEPRADVLAAALAEYLCALRGLAPPAWTRAESEVTPWWFIAPEAYRAIALRESPVSFARRGIFVTRSDFERV